MGARPAQTLKHTPLSFYTRWLSVNVPQRTSSRRRFRLQVCARPQQAAAAAISIVRPRRRFSAKVALAHRSCWSARNRAIARTSKAIHLSAQLERCYARRSYNGISLKDVYLTNAVKHFKYIWRGKRRIHQKPKRTEIVACRPWLQEEIELVRPDLVVALGATAAQVLLGASFRLTKHRGEVLQSDLAPRVMATVHPSSILRAPDAAARRQA